MNDQLVISTDHLRSICKALLDHLDSVHPNGAPIANEFFWAIPKNELYDVYQRPRELTIGQLSESWGHLDAIRRGESPALTYALVWLADVLRAIGHEVVR